MGIVIMSIPEDCSNRSLKLIPVLAGLPNMDEPKMAVRRGTLILKNFSTVSCHGHPASWVVSSRSGSHIAPTWQVNRRVLNGDPCSLLGGNLGTTWLYRGYLRV